MQIRFPFCVVLLIWSLIFYALSGCSNNESASNTDPDVLLCFDYSDIIAPGWPAYGWPDPGAGKGLPSLQLFLADGGPGSAIDSVALVWVPYSVRRYNVDRDSYRLECASINGSGELVAGTWPNVCHRALFGAQGFHPITRAITGRPVATENGTRWIPGSTVFLPLSLDLRTGSLTPPRW